MCRRKLSGASQFCIAAPVPGKTVGLLRSEGFRAGSPWRGLSGNAPEKSTELALAFSSDGMTDAIVAREVKASGPGAPRQRGACGDSGGNSAPPVLVFFDES